MSSAHIFPWHDLLTRERTWCEAVVEAYGGAGVVFTESVLDLRALSLIGHPTARALGVLPLGWVDGRLHVAAAGPLDPIVIARIARLYRCPVVVLLAASPLLPGAIAAAYAAASGGARTLAGLRASWSAPHIELVRCTAQRGKLPTLPLAPPGARRKGLPAWLETVASMP